MTARIYTWVLLFIALFLGSPAMALAQESAESHSWLEDRFQISVGAFARRQAFKFSADGSLPEEEIDFDEALGVDDNDISASLTFRWNFGEKWSLWGQAWRVQAKGGALLTEDIEWENLVFQEGSFVNAGVENSVIRAFIGRKVSTGSRHEFGLGAGFHWLELSAFIEGEALICFILNAGSIGGVMGMEIPSVGDVDISDGYLDLYAVTKGVQPLRAISKIIYHHERSDEDAGVYHWRGKEITLEADPVQDVWIDGELGGQTPITVSAMHKALEIVVPA